MPRYYHNLPLSTALSFIKDLHPYCIFSNDSNCGGVYNTNRVNTLYLSYDCLSILVSLCVQSVSGNLTSLSGILVKKHSQLSP